MPAGRAVWKGHLRFNLVVVPVAAYTAAASSSGAISFNQLHKDCNQRIKLVKTCAEHGEVPNHEIVKGYEYMKGQYVIVDPSEIEKLKTRSEKAINIEHFVGCDAIDPRYFSGSNYYLLPDGPISQRPYNLLTRGLTESKRYGFATVFFSGHDQLVLVRPVGKLLVMSILSYQQDMKDHRDFESDIPDLDLPANEMKLARSLIDAMSADAKEFDYASYRDNYQDNLRKLIEARVKGEEIVDVAASEPDAPSISIIDALQRSLAEASKKRKPAKLVAPSPAAQAKARKRKTS